MLDGELLLEGGEQPLLDPTNQTAGAAGAYSALSLYRTTRKLVGREEQVNAVLESLREHGAAIVWGSPGEGKTAVAAEAGCRLQEDASAAVSLSVTIDMSSACAHRELEHLCRPRYVLPRRQLLASSSYFPCFTLG